MLGGIALAVGRGDIGTAVLCAVGGGVVVVLLGVFLGDVPVYKAADGQPLSPRIRSAAALYAVELGVDVALLSACWLAAYAIRFGEAHQAFYLKSSALPALPVVVLAKVGALLVGGLYRGFWRSIRLRDVLAIARALALGSLITVVTATFVFRFENFSRGVVVIDALLGFGAVVGSRAGLRLFRDALERLVGRARRAAVVGPDALQPLLAAGLAGEQHRYELVGALAPGPTDELLAKAKELTVETLLVAADLDEAQATALQAAGLEVRRVRVTID
jgi:UDP-GlcNAc:undecaprenyl-phosphate GlcNAc-1-phosphate transferase